MISELAWPPPPWLGVVPPQALAFSLFPGRARAGSWVLLLFSCHSVLVSQNYRSKTGLRHHLSLPLLPAGGGTGLPVELVTSLQPSLWGGCSSPQDLPPVWRAVQELCLRGGGALLPPPQPRSWSRDGRGLVPDPSDAVVLSSSAQSRVWGSLGHLTVGPGRVGCAGWWLLP